MSSKKNKKPNRQFSPAPGRVPRVATELSTGDDLPFQWRTDYMDHDGPFGWEVLTLREFCIQAVSRLHNLETMAWGEVLGMTHNHSLGWSSVSRKAIQRFEELADRLPGCPDETELMSLGFTGHERIVGIRDRKYFYLLWWDPDHQVSPSSKKHT